jgi:ABC-type polysaccharide/polyol phosphate export permease
VNAVVKSISDGGVITWRNLLNVRRTPTWLLVATLQPVMLVLLLAMVFGASLGGRSNGAAYREFLVPGIIAQTMAFNAGFTVVGLANDLEKGIIDRFRSLPMANVAVLLGRTTSDLVISGIGLTMMSVCGLAVGWRIRRNVVDAVIGYIIMLMFAFAVAWIGALIGLTARSVEAAQSAWFICIFPTSYLSSVFVPIRNMPSFLQPIAEWNPFSAVANATRELFGNNFGPPSTSWPAQHSVLYSAACCVVIVAAVAPLAVARYRRVASK